MQNRKSGLLSIHFFVLLILSFLASESATTPCANLSELFCTVLNDSYMEAGIIFSTPIPQSFFVAFIQATSKPQLVNSPIY